MAFSDEICALAGQYTGGELVKLVIDKYGVVLSWHHEHRCWHTKWHAEVIVIFDNFAVISSAGLVRIRSPTMTITALKGARKMMAIYIRDVHMYEYIITSPENRAILTSLSHIFIPVERLPPSFQRWTDDASRRPPYKYNLIYRDGAAIMISDDSSVAFTNDNTYHIVREHQSMYTFSEDGTLSYIPMNGTLN